MMGSFTGRRTIGPSLALALVLATIGATRAAWAQPPSPAADTRAASIAAEEAAKSLVLKPYEPGKSEFLFKKLEEAFLTGNLHWHPFFSSAYNGGGFTLGAGYATHVSSYNTIDVRGSYTPKGYIRAEAEFIAPRLFDRRGMLSVTGGWREATQVGFYGFGTPNTSSDDRANYSFEQPYAAANLELRPARQFLLLGAGFEYAHWQVGSGEGSDPSVEEVYTPDTLVGSGRPAQVLPRDRDGWLSTGGPLPAIPAAAATTASRSTTTRSPTTSTDSARPTTRRSSTFLSAGTSGCCRSTASPPPPTSRATSRFPTSCSPPSAVAPTCAGSRAGASATGTACCCRPSCASSSPRSSTWRSSTTPARSPAADRTSTSTA